MPGGRPIRDQMHMEGRIIALVVRLGARIMLVDSANAVDMSVAMLVVRSPAQPAV